MRPGRLFGLIVLLILGGAVLLRALDPLPVARLRFVVFDTYQQLSPRSYDPALPVRIIDIDEESLHRIGQWPWPRTVLADLVQRLSGAGAATIGLDIVLSEPDRMSPRAMLRALPNTVLTAAQQAAIEALPESDDSLAAALAGTPAVLGFVAGSEGRTAELPNKAGFAIAGDDPSDFVFGFNGATASLAAFNSTASGLGALNWIPDRDQVVRRLPLLIRIGDGLYPSFGAENLRVAFGATTYSVKASGASGVQAFGEKTGITAIRIGSITVPTDAHGEMWIRFTPHDRRRFIPAWKILSGDFDRKAIEGRIALIGASAAGLLDLRATPLDDSVPGVEIHAQAIEQMIGGDHLFRPDFMAGAEIFYLIVTGSLVAALIYFSGAAAGAMLGALTLAAVSVSSWFAYSTYGWLVDPVYPSLAITVLYIVGTVYLYLRTEGERRRVRSAFSHYMSPAMVARLAADPSKLKLGGENREMTLLFADVRGFTTISEGLDAQALTRFVNRLFTPLSRVITESSGTIDKYMGDAVMAFWNAPLDDPAHARHAAGAALGLLTALDRLNAELAIDAAAAGRPFTPVQLGVGLNTGICCVGNLGSEERFDYSVIGDDVNVASRLESLTKTYGVPIIAGERTAAGAAELAFLEIDSVNVRGKATATRIFALLGDEALAASPAFRELKARFGSFRASLAAGETAIAASQLREVGEIAPQTLNALIELYHQRLHRGNEDAPGAASAERAEA